MDENTTLTDNRIFVISLKSVITDATDKVELVVLNTSAISGYKQRLQRYFENWF
jgi:hypothetical protein